MDPRPGDPVRVEIRGTLAYLRRGQVGVIVDGWLRPVALHLAGDPEFGPNPPAPDVRVFVAPPPVLTPGETYAARGAARRFFCVGAADGVQLVDELGTHWAPDVVVRQWGPIDHVRRAAAGDGAAGQFYDRGDDETAMLQAVPPYIDGYANRERGTEPAPAHTADEFRR